MQLHPDDQYRRAAAFRDLHAGPDPFVIPNPWDAGTARLLAGIGFRALATTSGACIIVCQTNRNDIMRPNFLLP